jgi:hypothetical protein
VARAGQQPGLARDEQDCTAQWGEARSTGEETGEGNPCAALLHVHHGRYRLGRQSVHMLETGGSHSGPALKEICFRFDRWPPNWLEPGLRVYTNATTGFSGLEYARILNRAACRSSPSRCATQQIASPHVPKEPGAVKKMQDWSGISHKDTKLGYAGLPTATRDAWQAKLVHARTSSMSRAAPR